MSGLLFLQVRRTFCLICATVLFLSTALPCEAGADESSSVAAPDYASTVKSSSHMRNSHLVSVHTSDLLNTLAAAHGKVILVNFFAAFCGPCRKEIPELMRMRKEISEEDLLILGVAIDETVSEADSFVRKMKIEDAYPVYYGGEELARAYRIDAIPFNVIYNREGRIEASEAGYVPNVEMKQFLMNLIRR